MVIFRECLKNNLIPIVIEDSLRTDYIEGLKQYREEGTVELLVTLFEKEQQNYYQKCSYFL